MKKLALVILLCLPVCVSAQNSPYSDIALSAAGRPIAGAGISVCNSPGLATTAAAVSSNLVTLTMSSNPITAGFAANMTLQVAGFTGGDTYLNGGTLSGGVITGGFTILSVTPTTIVYQLTHANASATSNGAAFQQGNISTPCAPLASITSDQAGLSPITQPGLASDNLGNYAFFAVANNYVIQYNGPGLFVRLKPIAVPCSGAAACTFTGPQTFTNLTVSGTGTLPNINNIRIVDGTKFSRNAAGINAADADLGSGNAGEIQIPSGTNVIATDAQISIGDAHTLRNFGTISIDPVGRGPILLGKYSKLTCAAQGGNSALGSIIDSNNTAATNLIRARLQDGSLETFFVDGCAISGGGASFTRGVIDATGMNDKGLIINNIINQYNGGPGLYIDDLNTGSNLGSCCSYIGHNWFIPAGASGNPNCITISHGNTNSAILQNYEFQDNECAAAGLTTTNAGFRIVNSFAGAGVLRGILIENLYCNTYPNTCLDINGGQDITVNHVVALGGSSTTVQIDNTTNNQSINLWNIFNSGSGSTIVDSVNSRTIPNTMVNHYPFINTNALTQSVEYLGSVFVASGNVKPVAHMVVDTVTLSGGSATVTLSGAAAFISATSYDCDAHDATSGGNMAVVKASGSSFTISAGTGTDPATFKCIGN